MGDVRPYGLSEFTVLPLYTDGEDDEPTSVLVWGGYGEPDRRDRPKTRAELFAYYGDESKDFALPYLIRLLRFDVKTNAWKKLKPTSDILPKSQSFAAQVKSDNGVLHLLIGEGYGIDPGKFDKNKED